MENTNQNQIVEPTIAQDVAVEVPEYKEPEVISVVPVDESKYTKIDCLDEDPILDRQRFCLISFISPEGIMNCNIRGLKIRGSYETRERAEKEAEKLRQNDKYFDIFVGEVGKWMPWDPSADKIEEVKYKDPRLNAVMHNIKDKRDEKETTTLNELVGRKKEIIDASPETHKERVRNMIKEGSSQISDATVKEEVPKKKDHHIKPASRNPEDVKERMRRTLEAKKQKKN
jgi:hypothetical protein